MCMYACAHVIPPHFSWMPPTSHLFEVDTSGALPPRRVSKLVTISADPSCLPNPSPGGVVLVVLPLARRTQLMLPLPQKSPLSPLANSPRVLQRPLPSRGFKRRHVLKCMPPLRLLHLTRQRLRLGWLFSLLVVWLLLAPHLAMTLQGESHHRLRRGKGWC